MEILVDFIKNIFEESYNSPYLEYLSEGTEGTFVSIDDVWKVNNE